MKLDDFEREYYKEKLEEAKNAESVLNQAQVNFQTANSNFMGFVQYMAKKYNLPEGTQFTPDGEVVKPKS